MPTRELTKCEWAELEKEAAAYGRSIIGNKPKEDEVLRIANELLGMTQEAVSFRVNMEVTYNTVKKDRQKVIVLLVAMAAAHAHRNKKENTK